MSNFDLTFCKVYIYAKGWPGINLGASHESCAHPSVQAPLAQIRVRPGSNHFKILFNGLFAGQQTVCKTITNRAAQLSFALSVKLGQAYGL